MTIEQIIIEQEEFIKQVSLTLDFLKAYKGNQAEFELLISREVGEFYRFDFTNDEYMWESIDELTFDIVHSKKKFVLKGNGIFETLQFAKPKKKASNADDIKAWITKYPEDGWVL